MYRYIHTARQEYRFVSSVEVSSRSHVFHREEPSADFDRTVNKKKERKKRIKHSYRSTTQTQIHTKYIQSMQM